MVKNQLPAFRMPERHHTELWAGNLSEGRDHHQARRPGRLVGGNADRAKET